MATSKKTAEKAKAEPATDDIVREDALPRGAWIQNAHEALGVTPEVVRAALSLTKGDTYNRAEVVQAVDAYMKRPVD